MQFCIAADVMPVDKITLILQEGSCLDWAYWSTSLIKTTWPDWIVRGFVFQGSVSCVEKAKWDYLPFPTGSCCCFLQELFMKNDSVFQILVKILFPFLMWTIESKVLFWWPVLLLFPLPSPSWVNIPPTISFVISITLWLGRLEFHWESGLHSNLVTSNTVHLHPFVGNL